MLLTDRIRDVLPRLGRLSPSKLPRRRSDASPAPLRYKVLKRSFRCGGNATVDLCFDKLTGQRVVLKRIATDSPHHAEREASIHRAVSDLEHPCISQFIDMYTDRSGHVHLVLEYCEGGDLIDLVRVGEGMPEVQALDHAADLMNALTTLHAAGYAHADVKIDNCCLSRDGRLKLIDFGGTVSIDEINHTFRPGSSTLTYTAPEVFANKCTDPRAADVWSAGVVLFTLLTGTLPWDIATSRDHAYLRHWRGEESARWRSLPDDVRALLHQMLHISPAERITAAGATKKLMGITSARRRAMEKQELVA